MGTIYWPEVVVGCKLDARKKEGIWGKKDEEEKTRLPHGSYVLGKGLCVHNFNSSNLTSKIFRILGGVMFLKGIARDALFF